MQEKLVSIEERVEEAVDFRRELKVLEVNEANRVQNQINDVCYKERKILKNKHVNIIENFTIKGKRNKLT
jgi:hypothetical protein